MMSIKLALLLLQAMNLLFGGAVVVNLFNWFIAPIFALSPIGYAYGLGILLFSSALSHKRATEKFDPEDIIFQIFMSFLQKFVVLSLGYLVFILM
jgi:hypothetical protein